ncbi:MAG: cupin protein [Bryobacterales bacterium]|nr:cupin protein [Bryobacterales bacterium]
MRIRLNEAPVELTPHGNPKRVLLRSGVLPNVTQVAVGEFPELMQTELHSHPTMFEIYFVLEGEAIYRIGDEEIEVTPGNFFYVPPNTTHNQTVTVAPHRIFYWGIATD